MARHSHSLSSYSSDDTNMGCIESREYLTLVARAGLGFIRRRRKRRAYGRVAGALSWFGDSGKGRLPLIGSGARPVRGP